MSGKMAACCVCHLDGGVPRELLPFLLNPALRYGDLHFCITAQLSQSEKKKNFMSAGKRGVGIVQVSNGMCGTAPYTAPFLYLFADGDGCSGGKGIMLE